MDAITRINLQKQPKKDFLGETKAVVEEAMQPQLMDTEKVAKTLIQPTIDKVSPEVEQQPFNPEKVAENGTNQVVPRVSPRIPTPVTTPINTPPADIQVNASQNIKQLQSDISKKHGDNTNLPLSPTKLTGVTADPITAKTEAIQQNKQNISDINYNQKINSNTQVTPELAKEIMQREGLQGLWSAINKESAYEGQDEIDKREKREKQRNLITSIADGLSSIANLGGTLAGGVNQKQTSLSEANMKRREYQRQLREKDRDKWQAMMMRTGEQQQNYELARRRQEIQYQDNILQHKYNQERIELENLKEKRLMAKDERDAQLIDYRIGLLEAQANKTKADIENNRSRTEAYVQKSASDASANQTRAGASMKNANAAQQRANDNSIKTQKEIEMRANGTWNKSSATGSGAGNKYTPTVQPPTTTRQPEKKKTAKQPTNSDPLGIL